MRKINSIHSMRAFILKAKSQKKRVGFVPTMGAFHKGHLSLMRRARRENDIVIASIYVNPTQFGPNEDFTKYPRQEKKDELLAKKEKIDIIFHPSDKKIYPSGYLTYVDVSQINKVLCGKFRPVHFRGVTTIITKLLNIVSPDTLYLGQKDAQQVIVIKKMVKDLNIPVKVISCPTVRESDGLAMSSRNQYLSSKQRREAPIIYRSLKEAKQKIRNGEVKAKQICKFIRANIRKHSSADIEYLECVDIDNLLPLTTITNKTLIAIAVKFGKTRLIDNVIIN